MGCVSSKVMHMQAEKEGLIDEKEKQRIDELKLRKAPARSKKRSFSGHEVALTSSSYGKLDPPKESGPALERAICRDPSSRIFFRSKRQELGSDSGYINSRRFSGTEVINLWELMEGLEEESSPRYSPLVLSPPKKLLKSVSLPASRSSALFIVSGENAPAGFKIYVKDIASAIHNFARFDRADKENSKSTNGKDFSSKVKKKKGAPARIMSLAMAEKENSPRIDVPDDFSFVGSSATPILGGWGSKFSSQTEEFESKLQSKVESPVLSRTGSIKRSLGDGALSGKIIRPNSSDSIASSFRRDSSSRRFFDPELLATIEKAFEQIKAQDWQFNSVSKSVPLSSQSMKSDAETKRNKIPVSSKSANLPATDINMDDQKVFLRNYTGDDPLKGFKFICPPGGEDRVVIYFTSLRGIRKTYEECSEMLALIRSFHIQIDERDIFMHSEFKQELKDLAGMDAPVPRLFIKGRYIGGLKEAFFLHEEGKLGNLLTGIAEEDPFKICDGCGGSRFMLCLDCRGSCKIITQNGATAVKRCRFCNENGLVRCHFCC